MEDLHVALLKVRGLVKSYGRRRVVDGVDFEVDPGEIVGLLGPNGAGKTTTFRMACGMIDPDAGHVTLAGQDVTNWPMYRRAKEGGMGYLAQESSVFRKLSVQKNLLGVMEMLGMNRKLRNRRAEQLMEQFGITKLRKSKAMSLSGGERRRLEIARALVSDPQIILLDEPFTGIDPVTIDSIQPIIRDLRDRGIAILITDHQVRETLEITDRSYVIRGGQVLCHGRRTKCSITPKPASITSAKGCKWAWARHSGYARFAPGLARFDDKRRPRCHRRARLLDLRHRAKIAPPRLRRHRAANVAALVIVELHAGFSASIVCIARG